MMIYVIKQISPKGNSQGSCLHCFVSHACFPARFQSEVNLVNAGTILSILKAQYNEGEDGNMFLSKPCRYNEGEDGNTVSF